MNDFFQTMIIEPGQTSEVPLDFCPPNKKNRRPTVTLDKNMEIVKITEDGKGYVCLPLIPLNNEEDIIRAKINISTFFEFAYGFTDKIKKNNCIVGIRDDEFCIAILGE